MDLIRRIYQDNVAEGGGMMSNEFVPQVPTTYFAEDSGGGVEVTEFEPGENIEAAPVSVRDPFDDVPEEQIKSDINSGNAQLPPGVKPSDIEIIH